MSSGKLYVYKVLKTDYQQTFMSSLVIFCVGILVWASKFCCELVENSQEKISFIQILEDKVLTEILTKHCIHLTLQDLFSKNNQKCFNVLSPSFVRVQLPFDFCFTKKWCTKVKSHIYIIMLKYFLERDKHCFFT